MPAAVEMARWLVLVTLSIVLVIASVTDVRDRRIPNWTVLATIGLFLPWIFVGPNVSVLASMAAAAITFGIGFALYVFRIVGAGDSKLLSATSLFVGLNQLLPFLVLVALAGGVIAALSLVSRPTRALVMFQLRGKGDFGRGVPYGVAIAVGTVAILSWAPFSNFLT